MKRWTKRGVLALLLLLFLGSAYLYCQNNWLQETTYTVTSEKIPAEFEGFRIIQLSDLHSKMLVNRGLGSTEFGWRLNNRPEISVVTLRAK
ncbi:hypothetical protein [Paenibacillus sp. NPDC058177]|uniref:hypothetical protein n=1 Tax=Paenibacillus sp. NPDC058177 TaxID=3346369 RepID=UPI0036D8EB08